MKFLEYVKILKMKKKFRKSDRRLDFIEMEYNQI